MPRGHRFSRDIWESVSCATKLGLDPVVIEAVTGVSKRQIQWIACKEEHGDMTQSQERGKWTCQRVLKPEHLKVGNSGIPMAIFSQGGHAFLLVPKSLHLTQPIIIP